jgi:hypothetical protein
MFELSEIALSENILAVYCVIVSLPVESTGEGVKPFPPIIPYHTCPWLRHECTY